MGYRGSFARYFRLGVAPSYEVKKYNYRRTTTREGLGSSFGLDKLTGPILWLFEPDIDHHTTYSTTYTVHTLVKAQINREENSRLSLVDLDK